MSLPTINDVQAVDPVLSNLLLGYIQGDARFVASRAFPVVPVDKDSGTYYTVPKGMWNADEMRPRAAGSMFARQGYSVSTATYTTMQYGLEHPIARETRANSQLPLDLEQIGLRWLATQSLIRKERAFSADFMATSVWATDNTSATDWDDFVSGDPRNDILTAKRTISQSTGQLANVMVLGEVVLDALSNHPDLIDRLKYNQVATAQSMESALGSLLGLSILPGLGIYNSANENATVVMTPIIDDDALVMYVAPNPGLFVPSAGYTFAWPGGGGAGSVAPMYYEPQSRSDILQSFEQWDQKAVATDCGYFFSDIV